MIQKSLQLEKQKIDYILKVSKRARYMRLAIHRDGRCVVTTPKGVPESIVERFLIRKSAWIISKIEYFLNIKGVTFKSKKEERDDYLKYKDEALVLVNNRIKHFNKIYNHSWNKILIKSQKTRWGSCSRKGNLNFNYKIALLPAKPADYIIIHELCHLSQFNHSEKFWELVALSMPDYKEVRNELKELSLKFK
jgi:predicted metal-dependent hydrolase